MASIAVPDLQYYVMRYTKHPVSHWLDALQSSDGHVRWEAVDAIRHVMDFPENLRVLLEVAERDEDVRCRSLALHGLCDYLHNELLDPDDDGESSKELRDRGAESRVAAIARDDSDERVRENAVELLRLLAECV